MKTEKTEKIEGIGTIVKTGSSCVGCMAWETTYIVIAINGERYRYQSDRIDEMGLDRGDIVKVSVRVRDDKVWRFNLIENTGL